MKEMGVVERAKQAIGNVAAAAETTITTVTTTITEAAAQVTPNGGETATNIIEETTEQYLRRMLTKKQWDLIKDSDEAVKKDLERKVWAMQKIFDDKNKEGLSTFVFTFEIESHGSINLLESGYIVGAKSDYNRTRRFNRDDFYEELLQIISKGKSAPTIHHDSERAVKESDKNGNGHNAEPDSSKEPEKEKNRESFKVYSEEKENPGPEKGNRKNSSESFKEQAEDKNGNEKEKEGVKNEKEKENDNRPSSDITHDFNNLYSVVSEELKSYGEGKSKRKNAVKNFTNDFHLIKTKSFSLAATDFVHGGVIPKREKDIEFLYGIANGLMDNSIKNAEGQPYSDEQKCKILMGTLISLIEPMEAEREKKFSYKMFKEMVNPSKFLETANNIWEKAYPNLKNGNKQAFVTECKEAYEACVKCNPEIEAQKGLTNKK